MSPAPNAERLIQMVAASEDTSRGGFVSKDGVPDEAAVELAWRLERAGDAEWGARARRTCEWMRTLQDTLGGGFFPSVRASNDQAGFDKRTDSNARRLENLIDAWLEGGNETDLRMIRRNLDFFERVLVDGRGGFVAAQSGDRDVVPSVNGLAIHAYLYMAAATSETRWRDFAFRSIERVWTSAWDSDLGLVQRDPFGNLVAVPRLLDQVEMGRALVLSAHLGGRDSDLARARQLGEFVLARFEDPRGGFRAQAVPAKDGSVKKAPREQWGNARAALFLAELATLTGEARWREAAMRCANAMVSEAHPGPECSNWALAMSAVESPGLPERPEWQAPELVKTQPRSVRFPAVRFKGTRPRKLASD